MAWTTPTSRSTGDLITASIYNTDIVDNLNYLKSLADGKVGLTGNETVAGIKTFSSFPMTPSSAPIANYQVANKKYLDDYFGAEARGFSATMSSNQSISASTETKVAFNTEIFDTHGEYNNSTYRYIPQRAGKYLVVGNLKYSTISVACYARIYKNGSVILAPQVTVSFSTSGYSMAIFIVEMNGSSDYVELYGRQQDGTTRTITASESFFQAWYLGA